MFHAVLKLSLMLGCFDSDTDTDIYSKDRYAWINCTIPA